MIMATITWQHVNIIKCQVKSLKKKKLSCKVLTQETLFLRNKKRPDHQRRSWPSSEVLTFNWSLQLVNWPWNTNFARNPFHNVWCVKLLQNFLLPVQIQKASCIIHIYIIVINYIQSKLKKKSFCVERILKLHLINSIKKLNSDIRLINWVLYRLQVLFWCPNNQNEFY
jgi:hypothetical protein